MPFLSLFILSPMRLKRNTALPQLIGADIHLIIPSSGAHFSDYICGQATVLVSGDTDLLVLHPFGAIPILTPQQFIESHGCDQNL
ncbi:hypothetical protein CJ255_12260 [Candidatus Viridilinea mediisalina]|uniref:Toxin-antitoxin system toxin component, PIN family n=1 Tax=Candidatus Viridilinea mediisalina TaxID=2024553 RepID=A0A2A6RIM4_9CHLR|nr:hypothetical protein CJ255_12260 [Candidatus Viridilinea mediisalina]